MPAPEYSPIGPLSDLKFDPGAAVVIGGREIALFPVDGDAANGLHAIDGSCPHAGGPLATGDLVDGKIECLWHGWRFDLKDGSCPFADSPVQVHEARVVDGQVEVRLATPPEL